MNLLPLSLSISDIKLRQYETSFHDIRQIYDPLPKVIFQRGARTSNHRDFIFV